MGIWGHGKGADTVGIDNTTMEKVGVVNSWSDQWEVGRGRSE